jgi:hypothetical protein
VSPWCAVVVVVRSRGGGAQLWVIETAAEARTRRQLVGLA